MRDVNKKNRNEKNKERVTHVPASGTLKHAVCGGGDNLFVNSLVFSVQNCGDVTIVDVSS